MSRSDMTVTHPIEGQVVLLAGAKASVTLEHLSRLLERAQRQLVLRQPRYDRDYERVLTDDDAGYYLVEPGHWDGVGEELGLQRREWASLRRAHAEQLRRAGRRQGRNDEFETALEIRDVVVLTVEADLADG